MDRTNNLVCPSCNAPLKSERRIRVGKKIACPKCKIAFTVRPEDAERAALAAEANMGRVVIVLAVALLYLLGGAGLAVYCFKNNVAGSDLVKAGSGNNDSGTIADGNTTFASAKTPTMPSAVRVSPENQRKIDNAIADGVWFLKDHMSANGAWGDNLGGLTGLSVGFASLPGLTLLECGVPADDPAVQKAAKLVRAEAGSLGSPRSHRATYQLALAILFLDRLGEYQDEALIQHLALCLIAGQKADGGWSYGCPELDEKETPKLLALLGEPRHSLQEWHKSAVNGRAMERGGWDNSNTQFAVLALWVAQRHRVPIDKPIEYVDRHFRTEQLHAAPGEIIADRDNVNLDGSWYYSPGRNAFPWPSMTCSGLLGLAIGHGVAKDPKEKNRKPLDDPAIAAGLAMLAREIDRPGEKRMTDLYFLWSLQRVGVLYNLDLIDGKDWYTWGYKKLLPMQKNNGSWTEGAYYGNNPILNTCFALLFLKRANLVKDLTDKLQLLARMTAAVSPNGQPQPPARKD